MPRVIQEHIVKRVNDDFTHEDNRLYVTELLYCLRKAYFNRKVSKPLSAAQAFYIYRGDLFDEAWTPLFKRSQISCTYRVPDRPYVIAGRADFIDEDGAIADLKTHANLKFLQEPQKEHVWQVTFYAYCNAIDKGRLYYVDFKNAVRFDVPITTEQTENVLADLS